MFNSLKMENFKIGARLNIGFVQMVLLAVALGAVALYQMGVVGDLINELYEHPLTVGYTARDIRGEVYAIHDLMRRAALTGDRRELDELEHQIDEIEKQAFRDFNTLEERFLGKKEEVLSAKAAFIDWTKARDEQFRLIRTQGPGIADKPFYSAMQKHADEVIDKIQAVVDFAQGKARDFVRSANDEKARIRTIMIWLIGTASILCLLIAFFITRSITPPLRLIVARIKDIAGGDLSHDVEFVRGDEIGELAQSFREMQASLRNKAHVASAIAAGDFSQDLEVRGEKDVLGNAIKTMTLSLHRSKSESELQDWIKTGKNDLNMIIAGQGDTNILAREVIGFLAGYLGAQIGTLYLLTEEATLSLCGSYAFSKRKSLAASIAMGEGLVGQAALERDIISIVDVPEDYIRINSSLGDSSPRNIVAVPLLFEDAVKGVIELGSFQEFSDAQLGFLRDISGSVAIAFHTVQNQTRLKILFEETRRQAAQLQAQEEELRVSNEELQEQTASLKLSEEKLRQQQEELEAANEELEEKNNSLERQREQIAQKNSALEDAGRQLEQRARELETTGKFKSEFLANMSHELRTPLNSLLLLSRDLAENPVGNLTEVQVESAKIIQRSGMDLLNLIDEVLDLSKVESGKMSLKVGHVRLRDVADQIECGFRRTASEKAIDFRIVVDDTLPETISTDGQRLEQIIKNLLSNAFKFTDLGSVTVEFHRPGPTVDLSRSGLNRNRTVAFSVRDTGIGIPEDKQMLIFEAFQQVDCGTARKYGGTGLGLSISREIARLLGGEIQLESRVGKGSNFTLYLPLNAEEGMKKRPALVETAPPQTSSTGVASAPAPAGHERAVPLPCVLDDRETLGDGDRSILLIEDDPYFAKILIDQCHAKGFRALASTSGEEGLIAAEKYLPAAIVLDIKLPGMNGWTVLNSLKENPATRHIPVHVMSVEEPSIDAMQKGAIGFLTKPVLREDMEKAFDKIEFMVEKRIKDLLLVEDSPRQRLGISNLITDNDINIVEVESGAEAISALKAGHFDCMILDLGLPDMTGFDLLNRLEEEEDVCMPPVIVYTGKDLSREEEMELRKYSESIIIKGVRSEERLLDEVALFLHKTVCSMPPLRRDMIINLHDRDAMLSGRTILLVDDDMRNLFALSKILTEKGMQVIKAEDGGKAVALLGQNPRVDLVLLDIMMPGMDGYETARAIRKQAEFRYLPIIALTAKAMKDDRDKCIAAGASDYLAKPVEVERLLSMLRVWLYKRKSI